LDLSQLPESRAAAFGGDNSRGGAAPCWPRFLTKELADLNLIIIRSFAGGLPDDPLVRCGHHFGLAGISGGSSQARCGGDQYR
jgi:hypothetical protein